MGNLLLDDLRNSVISQIFIAERNLHIWKKVAENSFSLQTQSSDIQQLYSFVQQSSQINLILAIAKLYDIPKKYPTQSIYYFLQQIQKLVHNEGVLFQITETHKTKSYLEEFNAPQSLVNAIYSTDKNTFLTEFLSYYSTRLNSTETQDDIMQLKQYRDKFIAHNELADSILLKNETVERLLNFATEIVVVFGMAYHSTIWMYEQQSFITRDAERNAFFITSTLEKLKDR